MSYVSAPMSGIPFPAWAIPDGVPYERLPNAQVRFPNASVEALMNLDEKATGFVCEHWEESKNWLQFWVGGSPYTLFYEGNDS